MEVSLGLFYILAYISEIRGSHSGVIEDSAHPGCDAVCVGPDVSNEHVTFILKGSRTIDHSRFLIRIITILTLTPASLVNNEGLSPFN
jgi:hypothetical protein